MIEAGKALFLSLWTERLTTLRTGLSVSDCVSRLRAELGAGLVMGGSGAVIGRVGSGQATLKRKIFYGNSLATVVRARLVQNREGGTEIRCLSNGSGYARGFMAMWFTFILLWWVGATITVVFTRDPWGVLFVLFPVPMLAFGVGFVVFCRYLARNDEAVVLDYLRNRLEAR